MSTTRHDHTWGTGSAQRCSEIDFLISFPNIVNGKIDTKHFLTASRATLRVIDKFGKVFAPIKYDMQNNIEVGKHDNSTSLLHSIVQLFMISQKIMTKYAADKDKNSTLQDLILSETSSNRKIIIVEALVWLTRGLRMIQLFLERIVISCRIGESTEDLVANIKDSYKESLEPHHGWMAQQLFGLLSRMVPSRSQLLLALANNLPDKEDSTLCILENFTQGLKKNLMTLQRFMHENQLGMIS